MEAQTNTEENFEESRRRSEKEIEELIRRLEGAGQIERFSILWNLTGGKNFVLVNDALRRIPLETVLFHALFDKGLIYADISCCKFWIISAVRQVGMLETIHWIRSHLKVSPLCVYKSFYSLEGILSMLHDHREERFRISEGFEVMTDEEFDRAREALKQLSKDFKSCYPQFASTTSYGTHPDGGPRSEWWSNWLFPKT